MKGYNISEFRQYIEKFHITNDEIFQPISIGLLYYDFAYIQLKGMIKANSLYYKKNPLKLAEADNYLNSSWSFAYGMYGQLRVVIEAARQITKKVNPKFYKKKVDFKKIQDIVNIANDIVKHPFEEKEESRKDQHLFAAKPIYLLENNSIAIYRYSKQLNKEETIIINPNNDFLVIRDYLEDLAKNL